MNPALQELIYIDLPATDASGTPVAYSIGGVPLTRPNTRCGQQLISGLINAPFIRCQVEGGAHSTHTGTRQGITFTWDTGR